MKKKSDDYELKKEEKRDGVVSKKGKVNKIIRINELKKRNRACKRNIDLQKAQFYSSTVMTVCLCL
jgi:hypothetical protein